MTDAEKLAELVEFVRWVAQLPRACCYDSALISEAAEQLIIKLGV
jgi:hypothetical protein